MLMQLQPQPLDVLRPADPLLEARVAQPRPQPVVNVMHLLAPALVTLLVPDHRGQVRLRHVPGLEPGDAVAGEGSLPDRAGRGAVEEQAAEELGDAGEAEEGGGGEKREDLWRVRGLVS